MWGPGSTETDAFGYRSAKSAAARPAAEGEEPNTWIRHPVVAEASTSRGSEVGAGDALTDRHAQERRSPHDRHAVGEAHVGILQDPQELRVVERVHEEVDVRGGDLMGAVRTIGRRSTSSPIRAIVSVMLRSAIGTPNSSAGGRITGHLDSSGHLDVSLRCGSRPTSSSGRSALAQSATFHAACSGADSSAVYRAAGAPTEARPAKTCAVSATSGRNVDAEGHS